MGCSFDELFSFDVDRLFSLLAPSFMPMFTVPGSCGSSGAATPITPYGAMHDIFDHAMMEAPFSGSGECIALGSRLWREANAAHMPDAANRALRIAQDTRDVFARAAWPAVTDAPPFGEYSLNPTLFLPIADRFNIAGVLAVIFDGPNAHARAMGTDLAMYGFSRAAGYWGRLYITPQDLLAQVLAATEALSYVRPWPPPASNTDPLEASVRVCATHGLLKVDVSFRNQGLAEPGPGCEAAALCQTSPSP